MRCRVHEWHPGCGAEMHGRSCPPELGIIIQYAIMALPHQSTHHSTRATASAATTVRIKLPPVPCCWFVCILVVLLSSLSRSHYNHCMRYCLRTTYYSCWYLRYLPVPKVLYVLLLLGQTLPLSYTTSATPHADRSCGHWHNLCCPAVAAAAVASSSSSPLVRLTFVMCPRRCRTALPAEHPPSALRVPHSA